MQLLDPLLQQDCKSTIKMVYHTIPYRPMPYTIPYHTIPYHTIPYHTIPYHTIPCHSSSVVYKGTYLLRKYWVTCHSSCRKSEIEISESEIEIVQFSIVHIYAFQFSIVHIYAFLNFSIVIFLMLNVSHCASCITHFRALLSQIKVSQAFEN